MTPDQLWAEKYAARFAAMQAEEARFRSEAFVALPRLVLGEPIRLMTPADLHIIDGIGNPLVVRPDEALTVDMLQLLWILHAQNSGRDTWGDNFSRGSFLGRMRHASPFLLKPDVDEYLRFVFLDAPSPDGKAAGGRPLGTCFMAPLLVTLAAEIGGVDPLTGQRWSQVPLPVIYQYLKMVEKRQKGKDFIDRSPSDRLLSEYLADLNQHAAVAALAS